MIDTTLPTIAGLVQKVALAFAQERYGGRDVEDEELVSLERGWKRVRGALAQRTASRWIPTGLTG